MKYLILLLLLISGNVFGQCYYCYSNWNIPAGEPVRIDTLYEPGFDSVYVHSYEILDSIEYADNADCIDANGYTYELMRTKVKRLQGYLDEYCKLSIQQSEIIFRNAQTINRQNELIEVLEKLIAREFNIKR